MLDLEQGKHPPEKATQRKIAIALEWPLDWVDRVMAGENLERYEDHPSDMVTRDEFNQLERRLFALEGKMQDLGITDAEVALAAHSGTPGERPRVERYLNRPEPPPED